MSKIIYKYELRARQEQEIEIPMNAEFLCAKNQNGIFCLWYLVEPNLARKLTTFYIIGTGQVSPIMNTDIKYLGSLEQMDGVFIWHIFST